jgi:hypothetical protein
MENKTYKSDRERSLEWWRGLKLTYAIEIVKKYLPDRIPSSLTGREIEKIWKEETQAIQKNTLD